MNNKDQPITHNPTFSDKIVGVSDVFRKPNNPLVVTIPNDPHTCLGRVSHSGLVDV